MKSDLLDLNEMMNVMPDSAPEETPETSSAGTSSEPVQALKVPRNLNLSLNTELQKVLFQKMTVSGISGEMRVAGGALSLERLRMQLFGGSATASGSYSTAADPQRPALKLSLGLSGASFSKTFDELEMVQKLVPLFAKTGGDYSLSLDMTTALDPNMEPDLQSLSATGKIKSANIHIQNLEAFDALAKALDNDQTAENRSQGRRRPFLDQGRSDYDPAFRPEDGRHKDQHVRFDGTRPDHRLYGQGGLPAGSAGGILESVNVGIGGTFTSPKITLGVKEAAEQAVKNVIDQQIQKLTGSESLGEEIQKQADNLRKEAKRARRQAGRSRRSAAHETCGRRQGEGRFGEAGSRESGRQAGRRGQEAGQQTQRRS